MLISSNLVNHIPDVSKNKGVAEIFHLFLNVAAQLNVQCETWWYKDVEPSLVHADCHSIS